MGNAVSAISTRVSALKQEVLEKELKGDLGILEDQSMFYNNSVLLSRPDLNAYVVPGSSPQKAKDDEISTLNEEKWLCSMEENASLKSKQDLTVKSLFEEIDRRRGEDVSSTETTKKLQFLSRTYESILRMDERERRKAKTNLSAASAKGILNHISKSGLSFGLTSLFGIIKILGSKEPELYNIILESASNIVSELPPMGLNETDPSIAKILSSVLSFFNSFVRREFSGITDEHVNATYSILFGLYIATGNLGSALALSLTFLNLDPQNDNSPILKSIFQGLRSFKAMTEQKLGCTDFSWNTKKIGKHLKLPEPNDPGFLIRDNSDGWGTIMSEEEYTEGKVYFEMTWVEGATDYIYFGINNGMVTDLDASVPDGATNFAVSIKPTGGVYKNSTEKYNFQKFAPGDKVGVLLDMDYKRVTFYVNGVVDPKGPFEEELPEKVRLFLTSGGIMKMKFVINPEDMPSSVRPLVISEVAEVNPEDLPFLERALLDEEASEEFLKINPMEISKFIMQRFDSINSKFLEKLENREKSFPVEKRMGLTLDVQDETVDILDKLMITCSQYIKAETTDKQSKAGYLEILTYTSRMMRAHLTASELATGAILDQELRFRVMKTNTDIMNDLPNTLASEEATKTTSSCFSVFYKDPQEKLEYLNGRLEDQMNKVQISGIQKTLEDRIFLEMARPDKLFPALELINEKSQSLVEDYFHKLTEISSEVSKKLVIGEETSTGTLKLLETSQIALFGQAAKANFKGKWQDILLRYTLGVFENCQEVIQIIKEKENGGTSLTDEMTEIVKNTILGNLLESLLYLLMLTKMNIDFLAKVLPVLQSITTALQTFEAKPKVLVKGTALVAESYESTHPYDNSLDISYKVEIPGAKKYYLAFDPQFKTEKNCDYLELWKEEAKINKIMRFDGEDFPRERLEVENPQLFFSFHSDGSVNYWGWKIDIFGEVEADYYAKQWPDTTKDASGILLGFISIKLISGDFEMSQEDEKIKAVLQSPLLKYGIHDKVLGIAKPLSPIPESLIKLASVPGIGEKIRPKFLNQFIMSDPSKKIVVNSKNDLTIQEYFDSYAKIQTIKYSENQFIREFIEGIGNYASQ